MVLYTVLKYTFMTKTTSVIAKTVERAIAVTFAVILAISPILTPATAYGAGFAVSKISRERWPKIDGSSVCCLGRGRVEGRDIYVM